MRNLLRKNTLCHGHDLRDPCFVIGAKDRSAVAGDQGAPFQILQMGEHLRGKDPSGRSERELSSIIILVELRADALAAEVRHCVQVGDESQSRPAFTAGRWRDMSIEITLCINFYVRDPHGKEFAAEMLGKLKLAGA